jgi:hypothetical protein
MKKKRKGWRLFVALFVGIAKDLIALMDQNFP